MIPQGWAGHTHIRLRIRNFIDRLLKLELITLPTWQASQTVIDREQVLAARKRERYE